MFKFLLTITETILSNYLGSSFNHIFIKFRSKVMTNNTHLWYYLKYHVCFSSCYCKTDIKLKAKFMSTSQILFVKSMIPFWYSTFKLSSLIKLHKLLSQWKEVFIVISTPKISIKSWGKTWWGGEKKRTGQPRCMLKYSLLPNK